MSITTDISKAFSNDPTDQKISQGPQVRPGETLEVSIVDSHGNRHAVSIAVQGLVIVIEHQPSKYSMLIRPSVKPSLWNEVLDPA